MRKYKNLFFVLIILVTATASILLVPYFISLYQIITFSNFKSESIMRVEKTEYYYDTDVVPTKTILLEKAEANKYIDAIKSSKDFHVVFDDPATGPDADFSIVIYLKNGAEYSYDFNMLNNNRYRVIRHMKKKDGIIYSRVSSIAKLSVP